MKKVIALSCSPSQGRNSDSMLDAFLKGVSVIDTVEVEKIYLSDVHIEHLTHGNKKAPLPQEGDFAELAEKIQSADGLVIATPTYNFSVPAHLKNFVDRAYFFALDPEKKNMLKQPRGKLGYLRMYALVSGGTPVWIQKMLFFLYPPFWLRCVFAYYDVSKYSSYYSGDEQTFNNTEVLADCTKKGIGYTQKLLG